MIAEEAAEEMLSRLDWVTLKPKMIVEAGCGTGALSRRLQARYPEAEILAVDTSQAMLDHATQQEQSHITYLCQDATTLALADESVDLLVANFLLPWHSDVPALLREWKRVLRPDGLLMFTLLGPDTLREWRTVLADADIPHLVDMHDVGDVLLKQGFADPVMDVTYYTTTHKKKEKLIAELQASGMLAGQVSLSSLDGVAQAEDGTWHTTYEVIYAHAFVPAKGEEISASEDGVVRVPLAHLRGRLRGR